VVVIILAGILSGVFTATESAATAVCWALLVTLLVYRSLSWAASGGLRQGLQDHRRGAAADRHLGRLRLLHGLYEVPQKTGELLRSSAATGPG
jgi:hypothetical protein